MWLPPISILVGLLTFRVDHIGYTGSHHSAIVPGSLKL